MISGEANRPRRRQRRMATPAIPRQHRGRFRCLRAGRAAQSGDNSKRPQRGPQRDVWPRLAGSAKSGHNARPNLRRLSLPWPPRRREGRRRQILRSRRRCTPAMTGWRYYVPASPVSAGGTPGPACPAPVTRESGDRQSADYCPDIALAPIATSHEDRRRRRVRVVPRPEAALRARGRNAAAARRAHTRAAGESL